MRRSPVGFFFWWGEGGGRGGSVAGNHAHVWSRRDTRTHTSTCRAEHFVPRSDLVLFVTSAYSPFSESERKFMVDIKHWGKKVVVVCNKMDVFETTEGVRVVDMCVWGKRGGG